MDALNAVVVHREDLSPETAVVRVAADDARRFDFEPGQYATLGLPNPQDSEGPLVKRVYSIASAPARDELEFYLRLVPFGRFTTVLWPFRPGDRLWLSPGLGGSFTLRDVPRGTDLLLVATGTGLAPYVSMLRAFAGTGRWRRLALVHGVRTPEELGYRAEIERAVDSDDSLAYVPVVSRAAPRSWDGLSGRVQLLLEGDALARHGRLTLDPATAHVLLCGNPAMIDDMERALLPSGFRRGAGGKLHFERYW